jgi:hypothetical protein
MGETQSTTGGLKGCERFRAAVGNFRGAKRFNAVKPVATQGSVVMARGSDSLDLLAVLDEDPIIDLGP